MFKDKVSSFLPYLNLLSVADISEGYQINSIILSPQRDRHILVWVCALNKTRPQGGWVGAAGHSADVQLLSPYASYGYEQCANICSVNRCDNGRKQELL